MDSQIEPPIPTSVPKLDNNVTIGPHIPTAAKHTFPTSSICPTNIRSTMEYKMLTNCAIILGIARDMTSFNIGVFSKSFCRILYPIFFNIIFSLNQIFRSINRLLLLYICRCNDIWYLNTINTRSIGCFNTNYTIL